MGESFNIKANKKNKKIGGDFMVICYVSYNYGILNNSSTHIVLCAYVCVCVHVYNFYLNCFVENKDKQARHDRQSNTKW